ncbi:hypothetical protein F5Y00DRAFT_42214 [Daldinia vernicosa]|uniref:uncharacterized protein n=1 Tax=Daldinia vernicosa TaxID=114800 RepID=UPI00200737DF|nr:uncharacterized protein F5Y00DRAFT_42214 [Daldinia vernicosa]KAI0850146.1 hypothetical protein F5Y00DRAFT_42214 [Daldinia vernicosa]
MMAAIFKNASRDLLQTVDWSAVSNETGHASQRLPQGTFTQRCKWRNKQATSVLAGLSPGHSCAHRLVLLYSPIIKDNGSLPEDIKQAMED